MRVQMEAMPIHMREDDIQRLPVASDLRKENLFKNSKRCDSIDQWLTCCKRLKKCKLRWCTWLDKNWKAVFEHRLQPSAISSKCFNLTRPAVMILSGLKINHTWVKTNRSWLFVVCHHHEYLANDDGHELSPQCRDFVTRIQSKGLVSMARGHGKTSSAYSQSFVNTDPWPETSQKCRAYVNVWLQTLSAVSGNLWSNWVRL